VLLIASLVLLALAVLPLPALAWNIPGHMLSGAIAYQDCTMVAAAPVLPPGYVVSASRIADRRMILAGYRLTDLLTRVVGG
jgi:hypothetical protein